MLHTRQVSLVRPSLRAVALSVVLLGASAIFVRLVGEHYAVRDWLFWRYLAYWGFTVAWMASCLSAGHVVVRNLLGVHLPVAQHLSLSFAVGVLIFALGTFVLGLLHLLGPVYFVAWPSALLAWGGPSLLAWTRRLARLRARVARRPRSPLELSLMVLGLVGVALVYVQILTPEAAGYDAQWYHVPLAEHYASERRIARFPEGWFLAAYPQLASYLYTWAECLPRALPWDRIELAAHVEFAVFVATLASVPALVTLLVPRARAPLSWTAFFLFPGIFLYDSNLNLGADHVAALWAIPIAISGARMWRDFSVAHCLLFAAMLSGALLTKYSVFCLLPGAALLVLVRVASSVVSSRGVDRRPALRRAFAGVGTIVGAGLVFTAPHWLKNWVFYGDPIYPVLHRYLHLRPWTADGERTYAEFVALHATASPGLAGLAEAATATVTVSFGPPDWSALHGAVPTFGSLFTLTLVCLPFLDGARRIWAAHLSVMLGVFVWFLPHHYDRYLQVLLPWMVGAVAATFVLIWRTHPIARAALVVLVSLQVIWGSDLPFLPTHNLLNASPFTRSLQLFSSGYMKTPDRLVPYAPWGGIARQLPPRSKVLIHEETRRLGIGAASVADTAQGGLSYSALATAPRVYDRLREMGVTHAVWASQRSWGTQSLSGDLLFFEFASKHTERHVPIGNWVLAALVPERPVAAEHPDTVAWFSCDQSPATGLYELADLGQLRDGAVVASPRRAASSRPYDPALGDAWFIGHDAACHPPLPESLQSTHKLSFHRGAVAVYVHDDLAPADRAPAYFSKQ